MINREAMWGSTQSNLTKVFIIIILPLLPLEGLLPPEIYEYSVEIFSCLSYKVTIFLSAAAISKMQRSHEPFASTEPKRL